MSDGLVVRSIELLRTPATRIPEWSEAPAMSTFDVTPPIVPGRVAGAPPSGLMSDADARVNTARLADEIYVRWCAAVGEHRQGESAWLAEVSHSLRRAARSFGDGDAIG